MTIYHKLFIPIPLYAAKAEFVITDHCNDFWKAMCKKQKISYVDDDNDYYGLFFPVGKVNYMAIHKDQINPFTISHEIYHATQNIMRSRNIKDEEAHAYLNGFINEAVYKFLQHKGIALTYVN
jgi:hypothetical protein